MPGKKGMRWGKNKITHSQTVAEALARNEGRIPALLDDLYRLAVDNKIKPKERMEAIKFLIEKSSARQASDSTPRKIILSPDDYALMAFGQPPGVSVETNSDIPENAYSDNILVPSNESEITTI